MNRLLQAAAATVLFASPAFAHDAKFHKGPKVEGEVVSLTDDHLAVATDKGTVDVTLSAETKYERGEEGAPADRGALKQGEHVMVSGHKLESGTFAASDVMIHAGDHEGHGDRNCGDDHDDHSAGHQRRP